MDARGQSHPKALQERFNNFIVKCCTPFAPRDSSDRMKTALYSYLEKSHKIPKYETEAQRVILGEDNVQHFLNAINIAKEHYKSEVIEHLEKTREVEKVDHWEVPSVINYSSRFLIAHYDKS